MKSPRIRHLVQPSMSVADRNLSITNEVRTIMTTTALPLQTTQQRGLELLVSRVAVGMLRWSQQRTARQRVTHEEMMLLRRIERDATTAIDLARLGRLN
jgi:hypothetical protein